MKHYSLFVATIFTALTLCNCTNVSRKDIISKDESYLTLNKDYEIRIGSDIAHADSILISRFEEQKATSTIESASPNPFSPSGNIYINVDIGDVVRIIIQSSASIESREFTILQVRSKGKIAISYKDLIQFKESNKSDKISALTHFYIIQGDTVFSKGFFLR